MKNFYQKVEFTANILIVIVALLIIGIVAQRYFFSSVDNHAHQNARAQPTIGKKLDIPDVNLTEKPQTLVVALQTTCHFCTESAPFYKRIIAETKGKNIKFVAVFPTEEEESRQHLAELGINEFEVIKAPFSSLDVSGTPTLILLNDKGEVKNFWVGKLPQDKETEVINQLNS